LIDAAQEQSALLTTRCGRRHIAGR
jgi:hypothetical protein